jgi:hypothetical protein
MTERRQTDNERAARRTREAAHEPPPPGERRWDEVDWDTWTPDAEDAPPRPGSGPDLAPLFAVLDLIRSLVPRELRGQFNTLLREVLLTLRSLIDWYLERLGRESQASQVEDIPIE